MGILDKVLKVFVGDKSKQDVSAIKPIVDKIKTFTIAYGGGIGGSGISNFRKMAVAGGTNDVIIADTTASLKSQLKAAISQIIAAKLSFTAPAISATVSEGGDLFQAQFDYQQNKEWEGTLTRTAIDKKGNIDTSDTWSASDMMPPPNSRNIWTVLDTTDYKPGYNNFVEGNWNEINGMFERLGNEVASYHSATDADHPANTTRCATKAAGVADGTDDDIKGLKNILNNESRTGKNARARDTLISSIMQAVISYLMFKILWKKASNLDELEEWETDLITDIAKKGVMDCSSDKTAERWLKMMENYDVPSVINEVSAGIQKHVSLAADTKALIKELEE